MKAQLQVADTYSSKEEGQEINISLAWSMLSHLGLPARYGGRAQDGSHEYVITSPKTGEFLTSGKGLTIEKAMFEAALKARALIERN